MKRFFDAEDQFLRLDGGMGTLLQEKGLAPGERPETWNLSHPEVIKGIHRAYLDAGAELLCTNTFGVNRLHDSPDAQKALLAAGIQNAREAIAEAGREGTAWVALDVGPLGRLLAPFGDLDFEEAVACFAECIRIGASCGVDAVMIETVNDLYEAKVALLAAKESCDLPVFVSCAYGEDGKLMTGGDPEGVVAMLEGMGADAVGVNCSFGPDALAPIVKRYLDVASVPVFCKPNAGLPQVKGGKTVYDVTPEAFAHAQAELAKLGVRGLGGCCGTTPAHIAQMTAALSGLKPRRICPKAHTVVCSYARTVTFGREPLLIGERINPTGKARFKQALREGDMDYLLREAVRQEEHGVDMLDVNVGLPEIDEAAYLPAAVSAIQAITPLPLQLDSSSPIALERALRRYNGKALINSVSGKQESMDAIFPLARKYGGVIIALTLDETGIPETAQGRLAIAQRILCEAARYGIAAKDIVFDPLTLTVSADASAALTTLEAVACIRRETGCHTSLGVSNVSFGLPRRADVTAGFFTMALDRGLSAAIMNPDSVEMMRAYRIFCLLHGMDKGCAAYIDFAERLPDAPVAASVGAVPAAENKESGAGLSPLQAAIVKGMRALAGKLTASAIATGAEPLSLVQSEIVPALNLVGEGFEKRTVYLPGLLMSAEAAGEAFEQIKAATAKQGGGADGMPVVLATVKGDIHDIGKNIVKLLLENYGFAVVDLGKDVSPEAVLSAVLRFKAPLCGLSALMTTTVPAMAETIGLIHEKAPLCKVVVGGAVLTPEYAASIGADAYAKDAMETVRFAQSLTSK